MNEQLTVVALGVHVLDVLVRPVEAIPEGQGGDPGRADPRHRGGHRGRHGADAGQARRGRPAARARSATTRSATCWSSCCSAAASTPRCSCAATTSRRRRASCRSGPTASGRPSTSSEPTAPTAPRTRRSSEIAAADHLHFGAPEFMGGEEAAKVLSAARERGVRTSADMLAEGDPGLLEWIAPALDASRHPAPQRRPGARRSPASPTSRRVAAPWSSAASGWSPPRAAPTARCSSTAEGADSGSRLRGRGRRHHRVRRRLLRRLHRRPRPRARPREDAARLGCAAAALVARRPGHRPRRVRPGRGGRLRGLHAGAGSSR